IVQHGTVDELQYADDVSGFPHLSRWFPRLPRLRKQLSQASREGPRFGHLQPAERGGARRDRSFLQEHLEYELRYRSARNGIQLRGREQLGTARRRARGTLSERLSRDSRRDPDPVPEQRQPHEPEDP